MLAFLIGGAVGLGAAFVAISGFMIWSEDREFKKEKVIDFK